MITESQLRQALNVVLRDVAQAVVQALPSSDYSIEVQYRSRIEPLCYPASWRPCVTVAP
jgi:hypothetical protein